MDKYVKQNNATIEFIDMKEGFDKVSSFLKDDAEGRVGLSDDGKVSVHTSWGDLEGRMDTHHLVKYGPGDYNIVENNIWKETYKELGEGKAYKFVPVEATELKEDNVKDVAKEVGFDKCRIEINDNTGKLDLYLKTLEGWEKANTGDFVLLDTKGNPYLNEGDKFRETYKPLEASDKEENIPEKNDNDEQKGNSLEENDDSFDCVE